MLNRTTEEQTFRIGGKDDRWLFPELEDEAFLAELANDIDALTAQHSIEKAAREWDESQHPRDERGRFADKPDSRGGIARPAAAAVRYLAENRSRVLDTADIWSRLGKSGVGRCEVAYGLDAAGAPVKLWKLKDDPRTAYVKQAGGTIPDDMQIGGPTVVDLGRLIQAGARSLMHLHPSGGAVLSQSDVFNLLNHGGIRELGAFSADGHYAIASKPDGWDADAEQIQSMMQRLGNLVLVKLEALPHDSSFWRYKSGDATANRASAQEEYGNVLFESTKEILEGTGIRYERGKL